MPLTMWILLVAAADAGERDCLYCCESAGVAECETTLRVYGPESRLTRERGGVRVDGLYVLGCDGRGWFDNSRVAYLMSPPDDGEIAMPESDPRALDCFVRACALPRDLVVTTTADGARVVRGPTGAPPTAMEYRKAPATVTVAATTVRPSAPTAAATPAATSPTTPSAGPWAPPASGSASNTTVTGSAATVVVIEGKTVYAQRAPSPAVASTSSAPAGTPAPSVPVAGSAPSAGGSEPAVRIQPPATPTVVAPVPAVVAPVPTVVAPAPTVVAPAPTVATTAPPVAAPGAKDPFAGALPSDPPAECYPSEGQRGIEARAQVMAGDDKRIAGDAAGAVAAYRAAVSLDTCSAYGWLGLGQSALALSRPDIAVRALRNTTRLMPAHYGAWADLGRAYEAIGQTTLAHDAYEEALDRQPNLPEANAGWRRTMK